MPSLLCWHLVQYDFQIWRMPCQTVYLFHLRSLSEQLEVQRRPTAPLYYWYNSTFVQEQFYCSSIRSPFLSRCLGCFLPSWLCWQSHLSYQRWWYGFHFTACSSYFISIDSTSWEQSEETHSDPWNSLIVKWFSTYKEYRSHITYLIILVL